MNVLISGACGRMGREVASLCREQGITVTGGIDVAAAGGEAAFPLFASYSSCTAAADVLVDFTRPESLPELLAFAVEKRLPLVLATTGFNEAEQKRIDEASKHIPVFQSANMSLGVSLLRLLSQKAAAVLGESYDVEIVERHHKNKIDAPSGTAWMLFDALKDVYPGGREPMPGRNARAQARSPREIGIHAVRGGTLAGTHEVGFYGPDETLTFTHAASSRRVFAQGALQAAAYLKDKLPGKYAMEQLMGEKLGI